MIYQTLQQEVDLWEAWIEFDHVSSSHFGTLYVIGEVMCGNKCRKTVVRKEVQEEMPSQLILHIQAEPIPASMRLKNTEVMYSEIIKTISPYRSVLIYRDGELVAAIDDIEVVI